jgi:hypothetical protein
MDARIASPTPELQRRFTTNVIYQHHREQRKITNELIRFAAIPNADHFEKAARLVHFPSNSARMEDEDVVPLSALDHERIVRGFQLPAPSAWALSAQSAHFQRYSQSSSNRLGWCEELTLQFLLYTLLICSRFQHASANSRWAQNEPGARPLL